MLDARKMPENWKARADALEKTLLFNTFHDIAPGTSIARVHEHAEEELAGVIAGCEEMLGEMGYAPLKPAVQAHGAWITEAEDGFTLST